MPIELSNDTDENNPISQLKTRLSKFETEHGRLLGLSYQPKNSDEVIISTSARSGTTWMQQICHQIRSGAKGGDMSFGEITEVVPWFELAHDQNQDLNAPQYGDEDDLPRIFKTHVWEPHCPKGCKHIIIVRHPNDVAYSYYLFAEGWFFEPESITMQQFVREIWLAGDTPQSITNNASYFDHFLSWYALRMEPNVLFLFFEDLKEDLEGVVERIAKFMSTSKHNFNTRDIIEGAVRRSTFEYMHEHKSQFDEKLSKLARNEACGLAPDAGMKRTKLHRGESGLGCEKLPEESKREIEERWKMQMEPVTGFQSYEELRDAISMHVKKMN